MVEARELVAEMTKLKLADQNSPLVHHQLMTLIDLLKIAFVNSIIISPLTYLSSWFIKGELEITLRYI
jgi:hypothetical protein